GNSIHKDLHLGNVLQSKDRYSFISDFGSCKPADETDTKKIYGVMPYMAPEILRGKEYTQKSDVYSLGIIINEIISIIPPFNDEPHDYYLALDICRGNRPKIRDETPDFLKELIQKCWDANPENRPTSKEVFDNFVSHVYVDNQSSEEIQYSKYSKQVEELKELTYNFTPITKSTTKTQLYETHTQAIYTSRLLNFSNLPEPVNCSNQKEFISSRNTAANAYTSECLGCIITDLNKLDFYAKSNCIWYMVNLSNLNSLF
ncbi:kinase-like domain-containing protein, partial [Glomus cerebriforme]